VLLGKEIHFQLTHINTEEISWKTKGVEGHEQRRLVYLTTLEVAQAVHRQMTC
jgi:hypothetical protein